MNWRHKGVCEIGSRIGSASRVSAASDLLVSRLLGQIPPLAVFLLVELQSHYLPILRILNLRDIVVSNAIRNSAS